jgi:putative membrane protein
MKPHAGSGVRILPEPDFAMKSFLERLLVTTLGVLAAANIVQGIKYSDWGALMAASLLLGILNAFLRPVLMILSLPLLLLTLGLFAFVINAFLLYFVGSIVKGFHVADFWSAFKGGIVITLVSMAANLLIGKNKPKIQVKTTATINRQPQTRRTPSDTGSGPVIDV